MKSDVPLGYAAFQLTPSRNRCELLVVCGEETERLASGLLKPFLVHLKAAEDQYATGTKEIKLRPLPGYGHGGRPEDSAWFTKGTIERFVRFVSTPEVLERVGTVEAELVQLEGAIANHANESARIDAAQPGTAPGTPSAASEILLAATADQAPTPTPSRRNSLDGDESPVPDLNVRRRVLRAMEARKMLLHKEQGMAFARATAAGFDLQNMEHLLVFADCFGASRLGDACVRYMSILRKSKESGDWDENEWPLCDTTSLRNVPTSPELRPRESDLWSDMHSETGELRLDDLRDDVSVRSYTSYYGEDLASRGYSGSDMLWKRGPSDPLSRVDPSKTRDLHSEIAWGRGSNQASGDEDMAGRAYAEDDSFFSNGNARWPPSQSSQSPVGRYTDLQNEAGNNLDVSNSGLRGHRQRRAWGPPPQFLAHQLGSEPDRAGESDGDCNGEAVAHNTGTRSSQNFGNRSGSLPGRYAESLPIWAKAAGQTTDKPWRPGSIESTGSGIPRLAVSQPQQGGAGSGNAQPLPSQSQNRRAPEAERDTHASTGSGWHEQKRSHAREEHESRGNKVPAPALSNTDHGVNSAFVSDQESPATGEMARLSSERPQTRQAARRASSPGRRSSSPMRRLQVGRAGSRRSGLVVMKSVNYASTKSAPNLERAPKGSEGSEDDSESLVAEGSGNLLKRGELVTASNVESIFCEGAQASVQQQPRFGWRDGLRVETEIADDHFKRKDSPANGAVGSLANESHGRAASGWDTPADYDMEFPDDVSEQTFTGESARAELKSPKEPKGRFYEQYREKRDAKLREEAGSKKAERDAKLKSMQEVLEQRKEEMAARKGRGPEKQSSVRNPQGRAEKLPVVKADLLKNKKQKDDEEAKRLEVISNRRRERIAARRSPSPTPTFNTRSSPQSVGTASTVSTASSRSAGALKQSPTPLSTVIPTPSLAPTPKIRNARRLSPPTKVSAGPLRGNLNSPATPASASKLARAGQRRPATQPTVVDNPMSRSVPSFAELRKENAKPALVRNSTYHERPRTGSTNMNPALRASSAPVEPNVSKASPRGPSTEDKKRRLSIRKSIGVVTDTIKEAPALAPLKVLKALPADPTTTNKSSKRLSFSGTSTADSKPFLRKGRGIGPGAGPNVRKSKVAAAPESIARTPEELPATDVPENGPDKDFQNVQAGVEVNRMASKEVASELSAEEQESPHLLLTRAPPAASSLQTTLPDMLQPRLDVAEDMTETSLEAQKSSASTQVLQSPAWGSDKLDDSNVVPSAELSSASFHEVNTTKLRQLMAEAPETGSSFYPSPASPGTTPHPRSPPLHSIPISSLSLSGASHLTDPYTAPRALAPASPAGAAGVVDDAPSVSETFPIYDAPIALASKSPFAGAGGHSYPQLQQSLSPEATQLNGLLRKKWGNPQKAAGPPSVKEPPRGLKRLLKFGRKKDQTSASTTSDWHSISSPSEGDDETDVLSDHGGRSEHELTHIGAKILGARQPTRSLGSMGPPAIPEDSTAVTDSGSRLVSIPFVRSSIPTPPANFKPREEHLTGGSLLKAPRSFFSLSSFRSKSKQ